MPLVSSLSSCEEAEDAGISWPLFQTSSEDMIWSRLDAYEETGKSSSLFCAIIHGNAIHAPAELR